MNYSIAVCDDDTAMTQYLGENIQVEFSKQNRICVPHLFTDPGKLLEQLASTAFHMIFLDMDMPGVTGFDVAKAVAERHPQTLIIFVTSHDELVYPSLQYHPFRFIRKRFFASEIEEVVSAGITSLEESGQLLEVKTNDGTVYLYIQEIVYFESERNYLLTVTESDVYRSRDSIGHKEKELKDFGFIRIHSGYLVNQRYIYSFESDRVKLRSQAVPYLPLSRHRRDQAIGEFQKYLR